MKKKLVCPICGARLVDANNNIKTEVIALTNGRETRDPDFYVKCRKCKKEIGVWKIR